MRQSAHEDQFAEVLVLGDQDPFFNQRQGE